MAENIKVTLDIEGNIEPTIANLKRLKLQLKETADPAEFKKLQQQIDDLQEAVGAARVGAGNFAEVLGKLPGPIGDIGGKVGGLVGGLKQFSQIKLNDIKGSFTELGKDIKDIGIGFANITGLTKVYTVATNAASKALNFFGVSTKGAATASKAFGVAIAGLLATTGLIALTTLIQVASDAWEYYSTKAERAEEAQKKLNETLLKGSKVALDAESASIKRSGDLLVAEAKARGANAAEIYKIEQSNRKLLLESQQRYYDDLKNKDSDEAIAALNNIKDTQNSILIAQADFRTQQNQAKKEQAKKDAADDAQKLEKQRQINKQISDNEKAAAISLLDIRDQERRKIINDYNEKIKLAAANGKDTFILEEAKLKALGELNDKYRKEDAAKQREADFERISGLITDLDYQNQLLDDDFQEDLQRLSNKEAYIAEQKRIELANTELTEAERLAIIDKYAKLEQQLDKDITDTKRAEMQARTAMLLQYADYAQQIGGILGQIAGENKDLAIAGVIIEQGAALGKVLIGTASGIAGAYYNGSINPLNAVPGGSAIVAANVARQVTGLKIQGALSAAAIIAGAANSISQINKAKTPGGGGSAGGGAGTSAPSYAGGAPSIATPQIQTGQGINATAQIAQTINAAQKPIEAYVVSQKISSQQALDRRTNSAATFS
jgi:hypothetical protein